MHEVILEEWDRDQTIDSCEWQRRWEATFCSGFGRADNEVLTEAVAPEMVGSTAVVVVLSGCQIITSNCGDSRAVLFRRTEAIPLTVDQKVISKSFNAFCALFFKAIHFSVYLLSPPKSSYYWNKYLYLNHHHSLLKRWKFLDDTPWSFALVMAFTSTHHLGICIK